MYPNGITIKKTLYTLSGMLARMCPKSDESLESVSIKG